MQLIKVLIASILFFSGGFLLAKDRSTSYIKCKYPSGWFHDGDIFRVSFFEGSCEITSPEMVKLSKSKCLMVKKGFSHIWDYPSNIPQTPRTMKKLKIEVYDKGSTKTIMVPIWPNDDDNTGKTQSLCEKIVKFVK